MQNSNRPMQKLILAAMFAALSCVATMMIQIPAPTGYVNLGDAFVILAGFCLGPVYGFVAGGLGPALADLLLGYTMYAPGTFVVKGLVALIASLLLLVYYKMEKEPSVSRLLVCTIPAEIFMALGYFAYETFCPHCADRRADRSDRPGLHRLLLHRRSCRAPGHSPAHDSRILHRLRRRLRPL